MNGTHPTAAQLDRYRRGVAAPAELLEVDAHIASCDRCFEAVRVDAHLTFEQMSVYVANGAQRNLVERHVALCEMCRGEVRDLEQLRDVMRRPRQQRRRQWLMAAAAILIFVFVAAWLYRRDPVDAVTPVVQTAQTTPAPTATTPAQPIVLQKPRVLDGLIPEERVLRGGTAKRPFALHAPVATVVLDDRPELQWAAATNAKSYDVVIADIESSAIAAQGESETTTWRPERPLTRGRTYAWQVTAHTGLESIVSPGQSAPEARFHVASQEVVGEIEAKTAPLERGVAMAERGALDEAERELERAGAPSLRDQVRSWREGVDYLLLPTTTNGAQ